MVACVPIAPKFTQLPGIVCLFIIEDKGDLQTHTVAGDFTILNIDTLI